MFFLKFRNNTIKNCRLCPSHYLSSPALSWDTMLNMIFDKLCNAYIFFEKGTRGGVSYVSNRYNKANNKYLKSDDPKQESKYYIFRRK